MLTPAAIAHTSVGWLLTVSLYSSPHTELRILGRPTGQHTRLARSSTFSLPFAVVVDMLSDDCEEYNPTA